MPPSYCRPNLAVGLALATLAVATVSPASADPAPSFADLLIRLEQTPGATEASALAQAAEARVRQARVRPNPTLALEAENAFGSGPFSGYGNAETTLSVTQDLELWGRRTARTRVATAEAEVAGLRRDLALVEEAGRLALAYAEAEAAGRRAELAEESLTLTVADARAALALVEQGREPLLRGIQAESEAAAARASRDEALAEREAAFARLTAVAMLSVPVTGIDDSLLDQVPVPAATQPEATPALRVARAERDAAVGGRVERVLVAPGQPVRVGQALVVLISGDAASLRAEADAAQAAYVAAEQAHGRDEELADQGVVAQREAEVSHAEALSALAAARAAQARAAAAGGPSASGRLNVTSPIAGVVTNVQVGPGGFVAQGGVVAEVTNPARVELVFNAPPQLAANVRAGASLRVSSPNGDFGAVVTGVAAGAGTDSGAAVIRARATGSPLPPAGSAVTGAIVTGETADGLTVPSEAVQTVEGDTVVFVQQAGGFQARPVLAGRQATGRTEILRGLDGSERVAGTNAFLLKAELAKGEAEHGH